MHSFKIMKHILQIMQINKSCNTTFGTSTVIIELGLGQKFTIKYA